MNFIVEEYKKEWNFFKTKMKTIFAIMFVVMIILIVGTHFAVAVLFESDPSFLNTVYGIIQEALSGIDLGSDTAFISFIKLFFNNARACLITICLGVVPFIFLSLSSYLMNGILVGAVTAFSQAVAGLGLSYFLAALVPHGIFEFPALVYSCALGIYMCKESTKVILRKSDRRFGDAVIETLRSYVLVILPLLVIAAFVESYITLIIALRFV